MRYYDFSKSAIYDFSQGIINLLNSAGHYPFIPALIMLSYSAVNVCTGGTNDTLRYPDV